MGKAPAFQFYVKDWLCDPELRLASVLSRGAWIDCLCFMWENSQRGKLTATPLKFSKLISGSLDEALHFLNDMNDCEFGDIEVPEGVVFPLTERECNIKVTIINRRMYSEYKDRQNTRLRVKRHREKIAVTEKKQKCNTNVTPSSPSPSPSSKKKIGVELPEWLNLKLWKEFKKYRTKIKAPLTEHAEKLCIADLKKIIDQGYKQKDVINQTIMSGKWKSFYPIKNQQPQNTTQQPKEFSLNTPDDLLTPEQLAENVKARKKLKGLTEGIGREI